MENTKNDKKKIIIICMLSAGIAGLIFIAFSIIQGVAPFGDNSVIRNDAINQYAPFLSEFVQKIKTGTLSSWSWKLAGGINYFGFVAYYLLSPFNLLALPFKAENINIAFWLIILVKTMFIGMTAGYYFQKKSEDNCILAVAFSLLYTFSGFYICYYYNTMWLDALIMLPLIVLGIENIVNGKKATLYFLSLAYAIFVNFYLGYMICIFSVLYFFYLLFAKDVTSKENKADELPIMQVMLKYGLASAFAGVICAVVILPVIYALGNSGSVSNFDMNSTLFNLGDFLSYHLDAVIPGGVEITEDTAPYLMSSMLTFLLVPAFFFNKSIKINKKIASLVILVVFYFSLSVPQLNFFWHGFTTPHGLPYRFTFLYLFFLITLAFDAVKNIKEIPIWSFAVSAVLITAALIYTKYSRFSDHFDNKTIVLSTAFSLAYLIVLSLCKYDKVRGRLPKILISLFLVAEIILSNYQSFYCTFDSIDEIYYFEKNIPEVVLDAKVGNQDDINRIELSDDIYYMASFPAIYQYNGISTFSSMSDNQYSIAQMTLGNYGNYGNAYKYVAQTPIYNSLFSMNYVYDIAGTIDENNPYYEKVKEYSEGTLYKAKYTLPMGYCISSDVDKWDPYSFVAMSVQSLLWKYSTGTEGSFITCDPLQITYNNAKPVEQSEISQYIEEHPSENEYVDDHDHDHEHEHENEAYEVPDDATEIDLTAQNVGEILNTLSNIYPFKVTGENCSFDISFKAENEGEYYGRINSGSMQTLEIVRADGSSRELDISERHISDLGYFKAGEEFKLIVKNPDRAFEDYDPEYPLSDSIQISVASLNEEKFLEGYNKILENGVLDIDEFEDTHIHGTVNSTIDGYMMMPMPYDLGWTIWVDGEEIEPHEHESHIMMFEITKGQHEIEMKYFPQGLKEGIFVSVAAVLGLVLVLLLGRVHKMKLELEVEEAEKAAEAADGDAQSVSVSAQDEGEADGASPPDSEE